LSPTTVSLLIFKPEPRKNAYLAKKLNERFVKKKNAKSVWMKNAGNAKKKTAFLKKQNPN